MGAYVVVDIERPDLERAARCSEMSGPSVERHGGRSRALISVLEGDWEPQRLVVIEVESAQAARDWYASEDYRAACAIREGAGIWRMVAVEGM